MRLRPRPGKFTDKQQISSGGRLAPRYVCGALIKKSRHCNRWMTVCVFSAVTLAV